MGIENPVHLIFVGVVALLVLGPKRLPEVARALGHGLREFREAMNLREDRATEQPVPAPPVADPPSAAHEAPAVHEPQVGQEPPVTASPTAVVEASHADAGGGSQSGEVGPAQSLRSADAPDRRSL